MSQQLFDGTTDTPVTRLRVVVQGRVVELDPARAHLIGRSSESAVQIDHELVSRRHLELSAVDGVWWATDLASANGTYTGGESVTEVRLDDTTELRLGSPTSGVTVMVEPITVMVEPVELVEPAAATAAVEFRPRRVLRVHALDGSVVTIGRADDNHIVLNDLQASRHHAELSRGADGTWEVVDLGSHNGTFLNGVRVHGRAHVDGGSITIGSRTLELTTSGVEESSAADHFPIAARDLRVETDDGVVLLDDVTFALDESSMMAVLGPSGAGKSTLLGALTGLRPATSGKVLCAGQDLYSNLQTLSPMIGYVPQDDLVQPELTVRQSLEFAARLRFPPDVSRDELAQRVEEVLDELGLAHRSNVRVGSLSGGQRKRVSIGLELLTRPSLIFLDEPTSGLDPGYERSVMTVLRRLADSGRTVVLVTHSVESLHLCDRVLCLAPGGRVAWYGPPEETAAYFGRPTYQEVFQLLDAHGARDHAAAGGDAEALAPEEWRDRFAASDAAQRYVHAAVQAHEHAVELVSATDAPTTRRPSPTRWCRQVATLTARYARVVVSDRRTVMILGITAPVLGLVLLLRLPPAQLSPLAPDETPLFNQSALMLFIVAMGITQVATSTSIREIVKERPILDRERTVGVSVSAYVVSKLLVLGGLAVVQAAVIVLIATARQQGPDTGVALGSGRLELIVVGALTALGAMSLGLLVSATVRSADKVALILPAVLGFHVLVTSVEVMPNAPSLPVIEQARYLSTARWGYAAFAVTADVEQRGQVTRALGEVADMTPEQLVALTGAEGLDDVAPIHGDLRHERSAWFRSVGMLVGLTALLAGLTILVLRRSTVRA